MKNIDFSVEIGKRLLREKERRKKKREVSCSWYYIAGTFSVWLNMNRENEDIWETVSEWKKKKEQRQTTQNPQSKCRIDELQKIK